MTPLEPLSLADVIEDRYPARRLHDAPEAAAVRARH